MIQLAGIIAVWLIGVVICYSMQRVEHESEEQDYTKGDRVINIVFSLLSWFWILVILIIAWVNQVKKTGYWSRPVKQKVSERNTSN